MTHPSLRLSTFAVAALVLNEFHVHGGESWTSLHNGGNTSIHAKNLPVKWSPDKGVAWSTVLPGYGQSAPVVWRGRIYVTAIDGDNKEWCFVHAYDAASGNRLWEHKFAASVQEHGLEYTKLILVGLSCSAMDDLLVVSIG